VSGAGGTYSIRDYRKAARKVKGKERAKERERVSLILFSYIERKRERKGKASCIKRSLVVLVIVYSTLLRDFF